MSPAGTPSDLLDRFRDGQVSALSRIISLVENHGAGFEDVLSDLHARVGRARRIGITGPPGAGKSTLADRLVAEYRKQVHTVAVVAVDPTSPFTGGALLGDRVRMGSVAGDPGVFVRSMATRGAIGGLATTTLEVCDVLDAFGFERIVVETVGVGQSELSIAATADTTVVVLVPESGDAVQVLKAGVMEIGDLFVVNKSDRPQADRIARDLGDMLSIRAETRGGEWDPPVVKTVATEAGGISDLLAALDRHARFLAEGDRLTHVRRERLARHTRDVVDRALRVRLWKTGWADTLIASHLDRMVHGDLSAYEVADLILHDLDRKN